MKKLYDGVAGFFIGLANIVAGLSGGTIAVLMGVFDKMIDAFANILFHPIKVIKKYWLLFLGIFIGLICGILGLKELYKIAPVPTSFLFIGLVIVGIPELFKKLSLKNLKVRDYVMFIIGVAIIIVLPIIKPNSIQELSVTPTICITLVILGFIACTGMLLPGISGSMILLAVGYYSSVLDLLSGLIYSLINGNMNNFLSYLVLVLMFVIGCLIAIVFSSRAIKYCLKNFFQSTYSFIIGLVSASPIAILITLGVGEVNYYVTSKPYIFAISVFTLGVGFGLGWLLMKYSNKFKDEVDFNKAFDDKEKDESIEIAKTLLEYNTVLDSFNPNSDAPFGEGNKNCLNKFLEIAKNDGFTVFNDDNYAGHIEFGSSDKELVGVLGHLDVVPVNKANWDTDPFKPVIKDGKLYARGSTDDKGPVVAAYEALRLIKKLDLKVTKKVRLIVGCDEESGSRCLSHYFLKNEKPSIAFSPDAEFPVIYGEKAMISLDIVGDLTDDEIISFKAGDRYNIVPDKAIVTLKSDLKDRYLDYLKFNGYKGEVVDNSYIAYGKSSHAMCPEDGINAISIIMNFLYETTDSKLAKYYFKYLSFDPFGEKLKININDSDMHKLTQNVAVIDLEASKFKIGINYRVPVDNYLDKIVEAFNKSFLESNNNYGINVLFDKNRHYVSKDSPLVKKLMESYTFVTKDYQNQPFTIGGGTYASMLENAVAFGPMFVGREDVCHIANEYIIVDDFYKAVLIYAHAIYNLIK